MLAYAAKNGCICKNIRICYHYLVAYAAEVAYAFSVTFADVSTVGFLHNVLSANVLPSTLYLFSGCGRFFKPQNMKI